MLAVGDGILDQIAHGAADFVGAAADRRRGMGLPADRLAHFVQIGAEAFDQCGEIDLAHLLPAGAPRRGEHGFGQVLKLFQVFLQPFAHFLVLDELGADAHGGDRRAQIVAHRGQKMALAFQRAPDLVGHAR